LRSIGFPARKAYSANCIKAIDPTNVNPYANTPKILFQVVVVFNSRRRRKRRRNGVGERHRGAGNKRKNPQNPTVAYASHQFLP